MNSRAVLRVCEPGNTQICTGCDEDVKFQAAKKVKRIIANVYENGKWNRVEHWHPDCYKAAGYPYGEPQLGLQVPTAPKQKTSSFLKQRTQSSPQVSIPS